jgi:hypothetical protein
MEEKTRIVESKCENKEIEANKFEEPQKLTGIPKTKKKGKGKRKEKAGPLSKERRCTRSLR